MNGPTMHDPPIVGLLPQFDIFATQASHFLAQFEHLAPQLLHEVQEISRLSGREKIDKRAVHDKRRLYPKSTCQTRRTNRSNRSGEGLQVIDPKSFSDKLDGKTGIIFFQRSARGLEN